MKKLSLMVLLVALCSVSAFAQKKARVLPLPTIQKSFATPSPFVRFGGNKTIRVPMKADEETTGLEAVTLPDGVETETYLFKATFGANSGATAVSRTVEVGFDGTDIYVSGISYYLGVNSWIKGVMNDDKTAISFASPQFYGTYGGTYDLYFIVNVYDEAEGIDDYPEVVELDYNAETGAIIVPADHLWLEGNQPVNSWACYGYYYDVTLEKYVADVEPVVLPEGLVAEDMPFETNFYAGLGATAEPANGTVKVAKDGDDVYFQGLLADFPEAWLKGVVADDEVEIPVTFVGYNADGKTVYACGYSSAGPASVYMMYDANRNTYELDGYMMLNVSNLTFGSNFENLRGYYMATYIGERLDPVAVPDELEAAEMPFAGTYYDGNQEQDYEGSVMLGVDGDDVYVQGLIDLVPEGWMKGTFNEDHTEVVFPVGQYVGVSEYGSIFVLGEVATETEDGEASAVPGDIVFSYDEDKGVYELQNNLYVNGKQSAFYYYEVLLAGLTIGNMSDVAWVASKQGYENNTAVTEIEFDQYTTGTIDKAEGQLPAKYYTSGESLRMYAANTLTISSTKKIVKIEFVMNGTEKQTKLEADKGSYVLEGNVGTWTGEENTIVFSVPKVSGNQARIQKIFIYYLDYATTLVEAPEDLVTETYRFTGFDTYYQEEVTQDVQVGFYGDNEVYFQGLSYYLPDAWVKGELVDGVVTIPNWYLGEYASFFGNYNIVFGGAEFSYDAEAGKFYSEEGYVTTGNDVNMDEFVDVTIVKVVEKEGTPSDPTISFSLSSYYGFYYINLDIPTQDVDGNDMVSDKMSYTIFVEKDGQQSELEFTTDLYTEIEENMIEIPYNYTDNYDIRNTVIYLNQDEEEIKSWTKIGIQVTYRGLGIEHKSAIVWFDLAAYWEATGIAEMNAVKADTNVVFDLQGRRVAQPAKGLYIVNGKKVVLK